MKTTQTLIPSVNFHLWEPCNFRCKFCFATFKDVRQTILPKGHLPKEDALKIIDALAEFGFSKITFAGGEPSLCPWIGDLIVRAKLKGLTTMIVSNGTGITKEFLNDVDGFLDWAIISIDSIVPEINAKIGRAQGVKLIPDETYYRAKIDLIRSQGIKLKINTVVNRKNYRDFTMGSFINSIDPERWKIFQALRIEGQNDASFKQVKVSQQQFEYFLSLNNVRGLGFSVIENDEDMKGTYIMVDPAGRFFDNTKGTHTYSKPILKVGITTALEEVSYDFERFLERGGLYAW